MRYLILISFLLLTVKLTAQIDTTQVLENIETLLEDASQENEDSQIFDSVEYLINNPIRLNTSSINEIMQIPFLDINSARAIIRHRNLLGGIYSKDQLENIEGVSPELIEKILPFLKLGDEKSVSIFESISRQFEDVSITLRSRFQYDLQERSGFTENKYSGTRPKFYNRLLVNSSNKIRFGAVFEKDSGERSFADFFSYHLQISDLGFVKSIILGDYIFEFGQGLSLWSPYSFSKGSDAVKVISRNARNSYTYTSTDENQFLRGITFNLEFGGFTLTPFYSYHSVDASIDTLTNTISSLTVDGYHRTQNEIKKENRVIEKVYGAAANYSFENSSVGLLYYHTNYNYSFEKSTPLKPFGSEFSFFSASYSSIINKLFLSGEVAYNNKSVASVNNLEIFVSNNFSLIFSLRNYPRNYFTFHGNGFGEKSTTQNETGFYTGFYWRTSYGTFNVYYDQFKFPFASSNHNFSSQGNDFLIYYTHKILSNTLVNMRIKTEEKDQVEVTNNEPSLLKRRSTNFRGEISYKISINIQLRTRGEFIYLSPISNSPKENGYLFFQDIKYSPLTQLSIQARIIFFSSNSYNSRLYEFENDLLGVMTNPAFYGEGMRWYIIGKYSTKFGLNISLKYSELFKPNDKTIGSGDSEIIGNIDNRLSFQLDWKL